MSDRLPRERRTCLNLRCRDAAKIDKTRLATDKTSECRKSLLIFAAKRQLNNL